MLQTECARKGILHTSIFTILSCRVSTVQVILKIKSRNLRLPFWKIRRKLFLNLLKPILNNFVCKISLLGLNCIQDTPSSRAKVSCIQDLKHPRRQGIMYTSFKKPVICLVDTASSVKYTSLIFKELKTITVKLNQIFEYVF